LNFIETPVNVILDLHVLKEAMKKSKSHKSTGEDDVNEMILHGPPELWDAIILLFRGMKNAERIAPRWKHTPLGPIFKMKGSRHAVVNYRPLGITSNLYKLYERCCAISMRRNLRNNPNQTGFRPGFSIHNLLMRMEAVIRLSESENTDLIIAGKTSRRPMNGHGDPAYYTSSGTPASQANFGA
jgi:hypothetical protein